MEFLQEFIVTTLLAIVFSFIVAISIAMAGSEEKNDDNKKEKTMVMEEVKLDKRLKVKGAKSRKRVKFADDVVVKNVDHFEVAKEPIKDFELSEKLSEKIGFLDKSSQGVIVGKESEEARIVEVDDQFGGGVVKESEVMPRSEELVKECDDVNMAREGKGDDAEEEGCKDSRLWDKILERVVFEENTEDTKADKFYGGEGKSKVAAGLQVLDVGDKMMSEEIGDDAALELVRSDFRMYQKGGDEAGDSEANTPELLDEALEGEAIETNSERAEFNLDKSSVGRGLEEVAVEKKLKAEVLVGHNEVETVNYDIAICHNEEGELIRVGASDAVDTQKEGLGKGNEVEEALGSEEYIDDDDDWEGVESSELEKVFAEAVSYVECVGKGKDDQLANLGTDVQMQLYGLQKLALEGPCREPQPMALKLSARAKWNAWQGLGSMSPEVAMEQYIKLLSDTDPGWTQHSSAEDGKHEFTGSKVTDSPETKKSFVQDIQAEPEGGRKLKLEQNTVTVDLLSGAKSMKEAKG